MLQRISVFFKNTMEISPASEASSRQKSIQMATCAVLLEAALADNDLSAEERDHIERALATLYGIDQETIEELISLALEERREAIDLWQFTSMINEHYDREEKVNLLDHIWRVILSDGHLDQFEDYLARQLRPLLRLDHRDWVEAKQRAKAALRLPS